MNSSTTPGTSASTTSAGIEQFGYKQELKRTLTFSDLIIYGLIFMVPIAPFAIFGGVFHDSGGMPPIAYIIALVAMMFSANSYSQMAQAFPMAGSVYTYAGRGINRPTGFIAGWMILLDYILIPTLLYFVAAIAMNGIISQVPIWLWLIAFVALNTVINYLGIHLAAVVIRVMLVLELLVLAIFLVVGIVAVSQGKGQGFSFDAFYNADTFSLPLLFGAASIAVLSFLGFDGISTLAEENSGSSKSLGRSMIAALCLLGVLFVVQTWVASMLVEDPAALIANGDPAGVAFYEAAAVAGGPFMYILTAASTAIAWGFANALVAQASTSRLLYAMARDRQLPKFLAKVSEKHSVPVNATFLVAGISLVLGLFLTLLPDGLGVIAALVNFGALTAFLLLNVSVVWWFIVRQKSRRWFVHLVFPVLGFVVLAFVLYNARVSAQVVGVAWLIIGIVIAFVLYKTGRMKVSTATEPAMADAR
ncbi:MULTISPECIES: APC family permease [Cryobacterium]|uniref:Amino acid transporter n=1 Tax=Cryobacterium levicorallinum TaxID=995038 RepID=A0ABY1EDS5_9MICO|nr:MULTISPECIES: APC family permease [Cryobacterium]SFH53503.1 Amino acid transporter [Cryobacterium levicorallinum]